MREIIRPEVLWREVIPIAVVLLIVLVVFAIAANVIENVEDNNEARWALLWTVQAFGAILAIIAAFGLFWRALNGDPLDLQFSYVLALLAGLLLMDIHWSLAIALGAIGVAMIIRSIWVRYPAARVGDADYTTTPMDRPIS
jgi:hypothetical protein